MLPKLEILLDKFRKNKLDVSEIDVLARSVWMVEEVLASDNNEYVYFTLNNNKYIDVIQYLLYRNGIRVSKHTTRKDYAKCKVLRVLVKNLTPKNIEFIKRLKNLDSKLSIEEYYKCLRKIKNRSLIKQR